VWGVGGRATTRSPPDLGEEDGRVCRVLHQHSHLGQLIKQLGRFALEEGPLSTPGREKVLDVPGRVCRMSVPQQADKCHWYADMQRPHRPGGRQATVATAGASCIASTSPATPVRGPAGHAVQWGREEVGRPGGGGWGVGGGSSMHPSATKPEVGGVARPWWPGHGPLQRQRRCHGRRRFKPNAHPRGCHLVCHDAPL
jgi:hypothetical protein